MTTTATSRVTPRHLGRKAYLYVRQSTLRQVVENGESTQRQYALAQRAVALGWRQDQIVIIDRDLGQSAAGTADRQGFQELVAEVGLGHVGIVLGLEVSRLARNSSDWHRLLEICGLSDTLILDEDGIYDPSSFNDRLLLGLKGTMSEAELHVLRARLRGGILNKARRGELRLKLPIGYVHDPAERIVFDPDAEIRGRIERLFETFARVGTASSTAREFQRSGLDFPVRVQRPGGLDEVVWKPLTVIRVLGVLHNPIYSGTYVYGRYRERPRPDGKKTRAALPRSDWLVTLPGVHPAYITWDTYLENQERITQNGIAYGVDRRTRTPREGPALLQGIVVCGKCGHRMWVFYQRQRSTMTPVYWCWDARKKYTQPLCQRIAGQTIDAAVGRLLVEELTPAVMELCVAVQDEVRTRASDVDRLRAMRVERAQYEADLARSRYLQVDSANRLVADSLEADWNAKLRALQCAHEERAREAAAGEAALGTEERAALLELPDGFRSVWTDPTTSHQVKKRIVRQLVEDVTLVRGEEVLVHVRLKGGVQRTLRLPVPLNAIDEKRTPPETLRMVDELLESHTISGVAAELVARGVRTGAGDEFTPESVRHIIGVYRLRTFRQRLAAKGMLSRAEVAAKLGLKTQSVRGVQTAGLLHGIVADDKSTWMYDPGEVEHLVLAQRRRGEDQEASTTANGTRGAV